VPIESKLNKPDNPVMKSSFVAALGLAALLSAGCSTPTHVDTGPIHAASFSFIVPGPRPVPETDDRAQVHKMIQQAISQDLEGKGLRRLDSGGDVTVAYLVIVGNNVGTEAINTYFGYGRDSAALQDEAMKAYTSSKNPGYFEAGTLLIDIIDAKTYKLLSRSFVVRPLLRNPSAEVRESHIQEAVDAALKDVRIAPLKAVRPGGPA
jgi:hypothetical protein